MQHKWDYLGAPPERFTALAAEMARRVEPMAIVPTGQPRVYLAGDRAAPQLLVNSAEIEAAANLERADGEVVLVLDANLRAEKLIEGGVSVQRCRLQVRRDATASREHVRERRRRPLHCGEPNAGSLARDAPRRVSVRVSGEELR